MGVAAILNLKSAGLFPKNIFWGVLLTVLKRNFFVADKLKTLKKRKGCGRGRNFKPKKSMNLLKNNNLTCFSYNFALIKTSCSFSKSRGGVGVVKHSIWMSCQTSKFFNQIFGNQMCKIC